MKISYESIVFCPGTERIFVRLGRVRIGYGCGLNILILPQKADIRQERMPTPSKPRWEVLLVILTALGLVT